MSLSGARALLERARAAGAPGIVVGLSGGKDSLITLDLAVEVFGAAQVKCFFMYLVKGLRSAETPVDMAARRYGVEVVKVPHWVLSNMYRYAVLMPHRTNRPTRDAKIGDVEAIVRKRTGLEWIAYGHREGESIMRLGMLRKNQGFDQVGRRVYPIWNWNPANVYAYLRTKRIAVPCSFGRAGLSGVDLRPQTLRFLKEKYPDDYAKVLEVFPFAEAQLLRAELYGDPREAQAPGHKHGGRAGQRTGEYRSWDTMIQRCENPKHPHYDNYGGRGVAICTAWRESFEAFLKDVGPRPPGTSIDRIDSSKNYEPGNVRWATRTEQQRNRRTNRMVTHNGETLCVAAWAERQGIPASVLLSRLNGGWDVERAFTEPVVRQARSENLIVGRNAKHAGGSR